jgi:hypothetical protein
MVTRKTTPARAKPARGHRVTLASIKIMARKIWNENGVIRAGRTHELARDLVATLAPILKGKGLNLYTRNGAVRVRGTDPQIDYILTTGRPGRRPSLKNWDRIIALADILHPEPPFDTSAEIWATAVQQGLASIDDVPESQRQLVHDAVYGRPKPGQITPVEEPPEGAPLPPEEAGGAPVLPNEPLEPPGPPDK